MKERPSNHTILPAIVRYCEEITDFERVLFSEIGALTNQKGYCTASNRYLADIFRKEPQHISRSISKLAEVGFLHCALILEGRQVIERRIFLSDQLAAIQKAGGSTTDVDRGSTNNVNRGSTTDVKENNTISIHSNNTPHFENAERDRKKAVPQKRKKAVDSSEAFNQFWTVYGYKKDKTAALKAWGKLTADEQAEALRCAPIYASETVTADADKTHWKPRRKFPATWLNGRGWEDYQEQAAKAETEQSTITPYDDLYQKYLDWVRQNCPLVTAAVKYFSKPQYILYREMGEKVRISDPVMFRLMKKAHTEFEEGTAKVGTVYEHFTYVISAHRKITQEI